MKLMKANRECSLNWSGLGADQQIILPRNPFHLVIASFVNSSRFVPPSGDQMTGTTSHQNRGKQSRAQDYSGFLFEIFVVFMGIIRSANMSTAQEWQEVFFYFSHFFVYIMLQGLF